MQIISEQKLTEFAERHPTSRSGLSRWLTLMQERNFNSLNALREIFPHADLVKKEVPVQSRHLIPYDNRETTFTVFNIGGNKARLIATIQYEYQQVSIHKVLTHAEYDAWNSRR